MDAHASTRKLGAFLFMNPAEKEELNSSKQRDQKPLINTPLQGGGLGAREVRNRFNGFLGNLRSLRFLLLNSFLFFAPSAFFRG